MQRELLAALLCLAFVGSALAQTRNRPPTISGSPPTMAAVGEAYAFRPAARDPEGRTLQFTIQRKPVWAKFSATTGRLSGTPRAAHVGNYPNIVIAVSDGRSSAALPAFTLGVNASSPGAATVRWAPPTHNDDGSTLQNLAGYRIYYGRSAGSLDQTVVLNNPGLTRYMVEGLSSARWYFAMTSVDGHGNESRRTEVVSKTIG